jgi:hypothetical protein
MFALSTHQRPGSIRSRVTGVAGTGWPAHHSVNAAIASTTLQVVVFVASLYERP